MPAPTQKCLLIELHQATFFADYVKNTWDLSRDLCIYQNSSLPEHQQEIGAQYCPYPYIAHLSHTPSTRCSVSSTYSNLCYVTHLYAQKTHDLSASI